MNSTAATFTIPARIDGPPANFETGATYELRSHGDGETCIVRYTVVRRTAKFVTLRCELTGEVTRHGVRRWTTNRRIDDGILYIDAEVCEPWGRYSMSPLLSADCKVA